MADLDGLAAAQTVKIAGTNTSGVETGYVDQYNTQLRTTEVINGSAVQGTLTISTTAVECKVGASPLTNRRMIMIQVNAAGYSYGFASGSQPFSLPNGTTLALELGPNISIWVVKSSGSNSVVVAELS